MAEFFSALFGGGESKSPPPPPPPPTEDQTAQAQADARKRLAAAKGYRSTILTDMPGGNSGLKTKLGQ